jgi:RNA polymerase sigma-70 factor, ECF subfamily
MAASTFRKTDWAEIVAPYDLLQIESSPGVDFNRAVTLGMRDGPSIGLDAIETALKNAQLDHYHLAYAARADMSGGMRRWTDLSKLSEGVFRAHSPRRPSDRQPPRFLQ